MVAQVGQLKDELAHSQIRLAHVGRGGPVSFPFPFCGGSHSRKQPTWGGCEDLPQTSSKQDKAEFGLQDLAKSTAVEDPLLTKRPHRNGEHLQLFLFLHFTFHFPFSWTILRFLLFFICNLRILVTSTDYGSTTLLAFDFSHLFFMFMHALT